MVNSNVCYIKYNMNLYVWCISATVLIPLILGNNTLIHCLEIQLQIYPLQSTESKVHTYYAVRSTCGRTKHFLKRHKVRRSPCRLFVCTGRLNFINPDLHLSLPTESGAHMSVLACGPKQHVSIRRLTAETARRLLV